ncbi:MAG: PQQ-binding-like beta-propeller repeat protein [Candidatus Aegiribacteria sp.]|nr:PQQ-binding-like beta-propeller repeat protein [Candidatus Aegiribacteria sp.]
MHLAVLLIPILISVTNLTITEPVDGETYDGDWLSVRAIVENENEQPDSVHYSLNGQPVVLIPRLNTDWYTYMANDLHTGYSDSPSPTDNTLLWTAPVTGEFHEFPTPVIVDGIVYYPSNYGTDSLYALNAATGELIWKYWVGYSDDAVTVKDGYLYIASDSLWCLDALTGEMIWATDEADGGGSTPFVVDGRMFAGRCDYSSEISHVYCFDAETGAEIWANMLSGTQMSCMTVWNGMVFVPTCYWENETPLYALDANTGSIIWENTDAYEGYWDSSPVVVDGDIYISGLDGKTRAIDAITGITVWEAEISPEFYSITATPAYHDGRLYFADQIDTYHCLDASSGSTIWSVPGVQHGSSGIADGIVFFGETVNPDGARVIALDCETGAEIWSYQTGGTDIYSSPAITDGVVYIAGMDWNLYAFGTGLKYTYLDDLFAQVGSNELIVTSFDEGTAVAADTINFTVTQTGINLEPSSRLALCASPNPFFSAASISFELSEPGWTSVTVYDLSGRIVRTLENSELVSGQHSIVWDGKKENGEVVSAGLYLCRIQSGGIFETTGLCLLR